MTRLVTSLLLVSFLLLSLFLLAACSGGGGGSSSSSMQSMREPCPDWDLRTPCGRDAAGNYYRLLQ